MLYDIPRATVLDPAQIAEQLRVDYACIAADPDLPPDTAARSKAAVIEALIAVMEDFPYLQTLNGDGSNIFD